ncbi:hypothetical protein O181_087620 [Austropuccinia psidii MF-1]|uniref:Reverse transcriptase Ty1/copia-type domain-containing protein n=1 Tax=Austropuccinia psidii MF-1 TaxID=1389203 RepID=A0A9Q3IPZ7_9BASI|nr:hypothetical protein [Austropuccinia psidii MF-1]
MTNCKPVGTPLVPNSHLDMVSRNKIDEFEQLRVNYCISVGTLSYLSSETRPDLSHSVSALSKFLEKPGIEHWRPFLHVLKYLKGTHIMGLTHYRSNSETPVAYSNSNWANFCITR